jgi:elongator complex protein 3
MTGQPLLKNTAYEQALEALCVSLVKDPPKTEKKLRQQVKQYTKPNGGLFGKAEIIKALRDDFPLPEQESYFWQNATAILKKPTRSLSGVTPVTVLTKPHPCPGRCVFCPNDVRMPKSYLFNEPGSRRAWENGFDPYRQVMTRLYSYWQHGHATEKIELIILGGTFTFYPLHYQRYFIGRCFAAMNDFAKIPKDEILDLITTPSVPKTSLNPTAIQRRGKYNSLVKQAFSSESFEEEQWSTWTLEKIKAHHKDNEESLTKCIGLVVETRPEEVTIDNLTFLRAMGCTKIQIGLQSNNDDILTKNKRGHLAEDNKNACDLLRQFGFKIHGHVMVNLWGATPSNDYDDFISFFQEPRLMPDELKIYPCMLVEDTELHVAYENKEWQPYPQEILESLLKKMLLSVPLWCRISRMIRDFSKDDIVAGNKKANLRQHLQKELQVQHKVVKEIRSREVRQMQQPNFKPVVTQHAYATGIGEDIFLQICDEKDQIYGYLRLTLPQKEAPLHELKDAALIRELHIYGRSLPLKGPSLPGSQHRGYGTLLLEQAAKISLEAGFNKLCVISGIGTRSYYRKKGFSDGKLYQYQHLNKEVEP